MIGDLIMKQTAVLMLIVLLLVSPAYAAAAGEQGRSDRIADRNVSAIGYDGAAPDVADRPARNLTAEKEQKEEQKELHEQLKEQINLTGEVGAAGLGNLSQAAQTAWKNQNAVRTAVQTFLYLDEIDGGIGQNVSAIARQYNNSVATRLQAEEQINQNTGLQRIFFGGDTEAAETILQNLNDSTEQIVEMKSLVENCTCDNETRALLMEQIGVMEQEQERLRLLADGEISDNGLFGWIWK